MQEKSQHAHQSKFTVLRRYLGPVAPVLAEVIKRSVHTIFSIENRKRRAAVWGESAVADKRRLRLSGWNSLFCYQFLTNNQQNNIALTCSHISRLNANIFD